MEKMRSIYREKWTAKYAHANQKGSDDLYAQVMSDYSKQLGRLEGAQIKAGLDYCENSQHDEVKFPPTPIDFYRISKRECRTLACHQTYKALEKRGDPELAGRFLQHAKNILK